jgi:chromosome segregation ATPase
MHSVHEREENSLSSQEELPANYSKPKGRAGYHRSEAAEAEEDEPKGQSQSNGQSEKEKIIEQNIRLKEQIFELSQQLEEILEKDKGRKRRLGGISPGDDEATLREKKSELRKQQLEIAEMKGKIYGVKRQLEKIYNNRNLVSKEQHLRALKQQLHQLDEEKLSLLRIKNEQASHLKALASEQHYQDKIDDLKRELARAKEEGKAVNDKIIEAEKVLRKNHEQYIAKQERLRELEQKVGAGKERLKGKKPLPTITGEMVRRL